MPAPRFTPRPRNDRDPAALEERWPSLQASFLDLLAECSMIVEHGRREFDAAAASPTEQPKRRHCGRTSRETGQTVSRLMRYFFSTPDYG